MTASIHKGFDLGFEYIASDAASTTILPYRRHIQSGKQGRRALPFVIVGMHLWHAKCHWQQGPSSIQGLEMMGPKTDPQPVKIRSR